MQVSHLKEGHPGALDGHHPHRLAELQVQDEDLSGVEQQHVVPLRRQVGQLQAVVERHRLRSAHRVTVISVSADKSPEHIYPCTNKRMYS